eukprot:Rmarinus@m.4592
MTTCGQCILHAVQHIHQSHNWDCGLACSEMALRFWGYENCSLKTLQEACGTKSVWTIDIAYLLQLFGLECELRTMILGVHPDYKNESYYVKDWDTDALRVNSLFQSAEEHGITVVKGHVSDEEIICHLGKYGLAIVLVDRSKLSCTDAATSSSSSSSSSLYSVGSLWSALQRKAFVGHYVLIVGHCTASQSFFLKDPACSHGWCEVPCRMLRAARTAFGTDEDILFLHAPPHLSRAARSPSASEHPSFCVCNARGRIRVDAGASAIFSCAGAGPGAGPGPGANCAGAGAVAHASLDNVTSSVRVKSSVGVFRSLRENVEMGGGPGEDSGEDGGDRTVHPLYSQPPSQRVPLGRLSWQLSQVSIKGRESEWVLCLGGSSSYGMLSPAVGSPQKYLARDRLARAELSGALEEVCLKHPTSNDTDECISTWSSTATPASTLAYTPLVNCTPCRCSMDSLGDGCLQPCSNSENIDEPCDLLTAKKSPENGEKVVTLESLPVSGLDLNAHQPSERNLVTENRMCAGDVSHLSQRIEYDFFRCSSPIEWGKWDASDGLVVRDSTKEPHESLQALEGERHVSGLGNVFVGDRPGSVDKEVDVEPSPSARKLEVSVQNPLQAPGDSNPGERKCLLCGGLIDDKRYPEDHHYAWYAKRYPHYHHYDHHHHTEQAGTADYSYPHPQYNEEADKKRSGALEKLDESCESTWSRIVRILW